MIGLILFVCALPFVVLYGLLALATFFEKATGLLPQPAQVVTEDIPCTECGGYSYQSYPGVCGECSRDWQG